MRYNNYINGQWKVPAGGEYNQNRNPHNQEEVLGEFPLSGASDVHEAVAAAKEAFPAWKKLSFQQRAAYLQKAADILKANLQEVGRDLTLEEGKTLVEGIGETQRASSILEYYAAEARQPVGEVIPSANAETFLYTTRVPVGPIGLITPWNFPIAIPVWKMAPALVYGNTVVIKPADMTPKSVYHIMKAFDEAGLPAGVVNCVFGRGSVVGSEIVEHAKTLKVGNPLDEDTFMGPAVSRAQRDGVMKMIEAGKEEATLLCGGETLADEELSKGFYIQPTVFENVSPDARIASEEIFGSVIALFKVKNYDEAVKLANDTEYGLSSSICTNNLTLAQRFVDDIDAGIVHVNSETAGAEPQVPFGGCKNSSTGSREQGKTAIEFYTQVKTVYMDRM